MFKRRLERARLGGVFTQITVRNSMSAETEVHLSNMRGSAVTVGNRTHLLLMPTWRPKWSDHMQPATEATTLGCGLIGLVTFEQKARTGR